MDFGEIFRVLRRRWRVSVPALLLTIVATVGAWHSWPTTYQSNAQITLLGPQSLAAAQGNGNNPYLVVGDLDPVADILATNLSTPQAAQQLQAMGVTDEFTAVVPPFAAGPFITLTLEGKNPAAIRQAMPVVISFAEQQLRAVQENGSVRTPPEGIIGAAVIAQPSTPAPVLKTKFELVAGVAVLGMVVLFLLTFGAEGRAVRRRKDAAPSGARRVGFGQPQPAGHAQPVSQPWEASRVQPASQIESASQPQPESRPQPEGQVEQASLPQQTSQRASQILPPQDRQSLSVQ